MPGGLSLSIVLHQNILCGEYEGNLFLISIIRWMRSHGRVVFNNHKFNLCSYQTRPRRIWALTLGLHWLTVVQQQSSEVYVWGNRNAWTLIKNTNKLSEGSQLAPEQWSPPQSIQVWSHYFISPWSKPLESLAKSIASISVAGSPIKLQSSIKNLGVHLDSRMSFDRQVFETCKASCFHLRALRNIRFSVTTDRGLQDCGDSWFETRLL